MIINTIEDAITQLRHIQLDSDHSPRDILHMILARGLTQTLYSLPEGAHRSALEFLCRETGSIRDYPIAGGIVKTDEKGRPFFSRGTSRFPSNDRLNEFLGTLAVAGAHFSTTQVITEDGRETTLAEMADAAAQTCVETKQEPGWSLMVFSIHPGVTASWKNEAGESWSVGRLLQSACRIPYGVGSCFGTHVIEGVAFAVSRFCMENDREPAELDGPWRQAYEHILGAIELMKKNQRYDGSIDRCWFRKSLIPRSPREWKEKTKDLLERRNHPARAIVYPTGHCLDAVSSLSMFLSEDRDWINRACYITAQTIQTRWTEMGSDISPLAHAVHALKLLDI